MPQTDKNKNKYSEHTLDENEKEKVIVVKHYHYYIPYSESIYDYIEPPRIRWPRYPQYPTCRPIWATNPESYTWTTTSEGTNGYKN